MTGTGGIHVIHVMIHVMQTVVTDPIFLSKNAMLKSCYNSKTVFCGQTADAASPMFINAALLPQCLNSLHMGKSSHMCIPKRILLLFGAQNVSCESAVQGGRKEAVKGMVVTVLEGQAVPWWSRCHMPIPNLALPMTAQFTGTLSRSTRTCCTSC